MNPESLGDSVVLHPMRHEDLDVVVDVHITSFPNFFLTFLGKGFLALLYEALLSGPEGIAIVASAKGSVVGFVAGVSDQLVFYRTLLKRKKWAFARASMSALFRNPGIAPRLIRALRRPAEAEQATTAACLLSIAVLPDFRGTGVGKRLVDEFSEALRREGGTAFCLITDRDDNESVNRFYKESGFRLARSFATREGRAMNEYVFELSPNQ